MVVASGRRLANLVNDLLDFSKLRHEKIELRCRPTDLTRTGRPGADRLAGAGRQATAAPVQPHPTPACRWSRRTRTASSRSCSTSSATPSSSRRPEPWRCSLAPAKAGSRSAVADTGIGIAPRAARRAYSNSFSQGDGSAIREQGGTGLGLAITRQLVELHGGSIEVESEQGGRLRFTFSLPLSRTTRAMLAPPDEAGTAGQPASGRRAAWPTDARPVRHRALPAAAITSSWWTTSR